MDNLSNKQKKAVEGLKKISPDNEFFWDETMGIPKFIKGKLSGPSKDKPEAIARKFLDDWKDLLDMQKGLKEKMMLSHEETDRQGFRHLFFNQVLNGVPVFEGSTQIHINPKGEIVAYKDYRITNIDIPLKPSVTKTSAIKTAVDDLGLKGKKKSSAQLTLYRDREKSICLAWEVEIKVAGELGSRYCFIDGHTGTLLYKFAQIRGAMSRMTYSAGNREVLPGSLVMKDNQTSNDDIAKAAHNHAKIVYRYYKDSFGRDSYDAQGARLVSTVHFGKNYNNAFWSDYYGQMVYGDGDGSRWKPLALALDIVGHELTHAVTSRTARFVYAEEAGALDESFADFFGVMVSNDDPVTDWEMGEGVFTPYQSGDALRDLSNPPKYRQPDHMDNYIHLAAGEMPDPDKNDNGYVHYNSGIPNKVGYLTVEGGTHHGITVNGMGRDKAEQVYYVGLTEYLSSATRSRWTFEQARYALLNACRQLYGDNGPEYAAIKNAWAAAGIGEPAENVDIIEKELTPYLPVPDMAPAGVESVIHIPEQGLLKDIRVNVNINHTYIGDLKVVLTSPSGKSVILHERDGGNSDNIIQIYDSGSTPALMAFTGEEVQGEWILQVSDHASVDTGRLDSWGIRIATHKVEKQTVKKKRSPRKRIPDNNPGGIESSVEIDKTGKLLNADISIDISHTWIGDLRVVLVLPSGTEIVLHDRSGYSRKDIKKVFSTESDALLQVLAGREIQGTWKLKVTDLALRDTGKLNSWGLEILYEA